MPPQKAPLIVFADALFTILNESPRDKVPKSSDPMLCLTSSRGDFSLNDTYEALYEKLKLLSEDGKTFDDCSSLKDFTEKYKDEVKILNMAYESNFALGKSEIAIKKIFKKMGEEWATKNAAKNKNVPKVNPSPGKLVCDGASPAPATSSPKTSSPKTATKNPAKNTVKTPKTPKTPAAQTTTTTSTTPIPDRVGPFLMSSCKFILSCHTSTFSNLPSPYSSAIGTRVWMKESQSGKRYYPCLIIHPCCLDESNKIFIKWKKDYVPSLDKWQYLFIWYGEDPASCYGLCPHRSYKSRTLSWEEGLTRDLQSKLPTDRHKKKGREAAGWIQAMKDDNVVREERGEEYLVTRVADKIMKEDEKEKDDDEDDYSKDEGDDGKRESESENEMDGSESERDDSESESDSSEDSIEHKPISKKTESKKTEAKGKKKKQRVKGGGFSFTPTSLNVFLNLKCKNKGFPADWSISYDTSSKRWNLKAPDGKAFNALTYAREYLDEINPEYEPEVIDEEDKKKYKEAMASGSLQKSTTSSGAKRKTVEKSDDKEAFTPAELKSIADELNSASADKVVVLMKKLATKKIRNVDKEFDFLPSSAPSFPKYLKSIAKKFKGDEAAYELIKGAFDPLKERIKADHEAALAKDVSESGSKSKSKPKSKPEIKPKLIPKKPEKPDPSAIPKRAKNATPKKDRTVSPRDFGQEAALAQRQLGQQFGSYSSYAGNSNNNSNYTNNNQNNKRSRPFEESTFQQPNPAMRSVSASAATTLPPRQAPPPKFRRVLSEHTLAGQTQRQPVKVSVPQKVDRSLIAVLKEINPPPESPEEDYRKDAASLLCSSVQEKLAKDSPTLAETFGFLLESAIFQQCQPTASVKVSPNAMEIDAPDLSNDTKYCTKIRLTALALTGTINSSKVVGMKLKDQLFAGTLTYEELAKMTEEQLETVFLSEMPLST
ncbi:hypothetical protein TrST_g4601 [Triparma strigata]|uniref:Uncharacterized protein n=1 Tax=Triparma strigata TaxID=1606541 RepID=A0A9W6ZFV7_9STRA|nr:hypothetical protein TrST_g4601 [Triparma strigata]